MSGLLENNSLQAESVQPAQNPLSLQAEAFLSNGQPNQQQPGSPQEAGYQYTLPGSQQTAPTETSGSTPWRSTYNGVAPAFSETTQPAQQTSGSVPWRATYNGVAPAFFNGQGGGGTTPGSTGTVPWRAPYNGVAPIFNPGTSGSSGSSGYNPENPNANGNQPQGPVWNPNPTYSWNTPSPTAAPGTESTAGTPTTASSGIPGYSQGNNFFDPERPDLNAALVRTVNFPFQMMIGGISGAAFGGPIQWTLNKTATGILQAAGKDVPTTGTMFPEDSWVRKIFPASTVSKMEGTANAVGDISPSQDGALTQAAQWYKDHFDPATFRQNDLQLQETLKNTAQIGLTKISAANQAAIDKIMADNPEADQMSDSVAQELQRLTARQNVLSDTSWNSATSADDFMKTLKATQTANPGTFTSDEMKLFGQRDEAVDQQATIADQVSTEGSFFGKGLVTNFVAGAGFVGLTMVADNYLNRLFGENPQAGLTNGNMTSGLPLIGGMTTSWNTNTLLLPMAFAAGDGWGAKGIAERAILTGAALVGGKILDKVLPASSSNHWAQLLQPTGVDSLLMGAAFLLPAASTPQRLAMIGGAWALGRVYNFFEGPAPIDTKDQAYADMQTDLSQRTTGSMDTAINKFKDLGQLDDQALKLYASDWLRPGRKYADVMSAYRGAVILTTAFAESRMGHGTLIPQTQDSFILGGLNLDVDSQALRALMIGQLNVNSAITETKQLMGQKLDGTTVTQQEVTDLQQVGQQIQGDINTIYGKHNIPQAVSDIENAYKGNEAGILRLKMDIESTVTANQSSTNSQFMGKQFRDMALIDLSVAQLKMQQGDKQGASQMLYGDTNQGRDASTGNGQQTQGYDGALDELALAQKYAPDNADLPQLEALANQLKAALPGQIQQQMANPTYNPLNVNGALNSGSKM